ncbi:mannose 6-phosphate receptor domain-containing protein [Choiromyces venosus 120613-1]|uniref:Mannose 6-phosphate receptor domain-containing protein n=1 Tax=Choiromyces venosus 120613-1 TaxID=1336337 RepID=A0A3N4JA22_9PEZI|nr:mannose 6-phosphate receptor domain-containing protein [Choiromyces venosus 120613-1]
MSQAASWWATSVAVGNSTSTNDPPQKPCTVISAQSGNFFDLRPLTRTSSSSSSSSGTVQDWTSRGYDYPANFTLNICAPVLSNVSSIDSIPTAQKSNISAFYTTASGGKYSIGSVSTAPYFRGRKLVLEYTHGSPCPSPDEVEDGGADAEGGNKKKKGGFRKTTLMSHLCDRDAIRPVISFVGAVNHCGYFFEVRSAAACPTVRTQALGPVSVFGIIGLVAALVYLVGGCVYQRTVMHARGWRQMPNYAVWAGLVGGVWALLSTLLTRCAGRLHLRHRSYDRLAAQRRSSVESENRLIDALDEDWGDDDN